MCLYVEKEQIWGKIASTGGKVNSQNEHFFKKKMYSHYYSRLEVMYNVVQITGYSGVWGPESQYWIQHHWELGSVVSA